MVWPADTKMQPIYLDQGQSTGAMHFFGPDKRTLLALARVVSASSQLSEPDDSWLFLPLRNVQRPSAMVASDAMASNG
jgi:hypothetical protein